MCMGMMVGTPTAKHLTAARVRQDPGHSQECFWSPSADSLSRLQTTVTKITLLLQTLTRPRAFLTLRLKAVTFLKAKARGKGKKFKG
jgi:hypothetical protein